MPLATTLSLKDESHITGIRCALATLQLGWGAHLLVSRDDSSSQAKLAVVSQLYGFFFSFESHGGQHRAKNLLPPEAHARCHACEDSGLHIVALLQAWGPLAPCQQLATFLLSIGRVLW